MSLSEEFSEFLSSSGFNVPPLSAAEFPVYRIVNCPTFSGIWSVTVNSKDGLTIHLSLGEAGFEPCHHFCEVFWAQGGDGIIMSIENGGFWQTEWTSGIGCDGNIIHIEGLGEVGYKLQSVWSPSDGPAFEVLESLRRTLPKRIRKALLL